MSHEKGAAGGAYSLDDCSGTPLPSGTDIITLADLNGVLGSTNPEGIIVKDLLGGCPTGLTVPVCDGVLNTGYQTMVLGSNGTTTVSWGVPDRRPLGIAEVHDTETWSANDADVLWYRDAGIATVDFDPPFNNCTRNDVWWKNQSASALTINPTLGTIDGAATHVLTTNQSVHLVWNATTSAWMTI